MIVALVLLLLVAIAALVLWRREVTRRAGAEEAAARAGAARPSAAAGRDEAPRGPPRVQRALLAERAWTRELRSQLSRLSRTAFDDPKDTPTMVLRIALSVLGAEKGLLLTRDDDDGDGLLDLAAAEGFDNDPSESVIAQH